MENERTNAERRAYALAAARAAARAEDWLRVIAALDATDWAGAPDEHEALSLLSTARLRSDQPAKAVELLDRLMRMRHAALKPGRLHLDRGTALVRLGRFDEGSADLRRALDHRDASSEAAVELASALARRGDLDAAEGLLDERLDHEPSVSRVAALRLRARIERARGRHRFAAEHLLAALDALGRSPHHDAEMHASLLHALVSIALDTLDLTLFARVRGDVDAGTWAPGLQPRWAALRRMRAIVELLDGNAAEAWRLADEALFHSAPGSQRVAALVTAAQVARAAGDIFSPDRLMHKAAGIAANVDWVALDRESRGALLEVVRETAVVDRDAAAGLLALYDDLPATPAAPDALEDDRGPTALVAAARGAVARARGTRDAAVSQLRAAADGWRSVGNRYEEARALLALLRLVGDGDAMSRVDGLTRLAPNSWLRRMRLRLSAIPSADSNRADGP